MTGYAGEIRPQKRAKFRHFLGLARYGECMKNRNSLLGASLGAFLLLSACGPTNPLDAAAEAIAANNHNAARLHLAEVLREEPGNVQARLDLAAANLALGDGIAAQTVLEKLPEAKLNASPAAGKMAHALLLQTKFDEALAWAETAGEADALGQWVKIATLLSTNREEEAFAVADAALNAHPEDAKLLATRGEIAVQQRKVDLGREFGMRALQADANSLEALMLLGRLDVARRDLNAAREHFSKAVEAHPLATQPLISLAAVEADLGDVEAAQETLASLKKLAPQHPMAHFMDAKLAFAKGDLTEAQNIMNGAEKMLRGVPAAQLLQAEIAHLRGNHETAVSLLNKFVNNNPSHVHAATVLGQSLVALGDDRGAWQVIEKPASRATASPQLLALASRLARTQGVDDPFAARMLTAETPKDADEQLVSASRAMRAKDFAAAREIYSGLIPNGFANNAMVLNNAALAELEGGDTAKAISLARQAHALTPEDPQVSHTLGWVLHRTKTNNTEALALLRNAYQTLPGNLEMRWHYANALAANGQKAQAKQMIAQVREFAAPEQRKHIDGLLAQL